VGIKTDFGLIETDLTESELRNIYTFIINFIIGLLKPVKKSDLEFYINKMSVFNLRPIINKLPKHFRIRLSEMIKNNKNLVKNIVGGKYLLDETRKQRPDLYEVLITYNGQIWLNRFTKYLLKLIFSF